MGEDAKGRSGAGRTQTSPNLEATVGRASSPTTCDVAGTRVFGFGARVVGVGACVVGIGARVRARVEVRARAWKRASEHQLSRLGIALTSTLPLTNH